MYLDERWDPPWPHEHLAWPDFGRPADPGAATAALRDLLGRARRGEAVAWVRDVSCPLAVETDEEAAFVATFSP